MKDILPECPRTTCVKCCGLSNNDHGMSKRINCTCLSITRIRSKRLIAVLFVQDIEELFR